MIFIEEGNCETRNMSGEWCTDCKEYDHARHFCPRFDRVIAEAVAEVRENAKEERSGKWNVIKKRPMDEEERQDWSERLGYDIEYDDAFIYTNLPDNGDAVLICTSWGSVSIDTFYDDDGCYFEDTGDMDGIVAWMPLPKPYKGGERSEE